jgi:3-oxoadipate enol-lactonase
MNQEMHMRIKLPDFTLAYDEAGSGLPLLFIHGYPLNKDIWAPQVSGLADAAHVLAPDLRGCGESEVTPAPYSMDLLADDCIALLDALSITRPAVVCGLSMGGYVTLSLARRYPRRLAGLILNDTRAGADSPEGKAGRLRSVETVRARGVGEIVEAMLPRLMSPRTYAENPALVQRVRAIMETSSVEGVAGDLLGMIDRPDSTSLLPTLRLPVLVIHGADDQIIPLSEAQAMQAAIPGARLAVIPGAGHLPNLEQPEHFNQAVREFIRSL